MAKLNCNIVVKYIDLQKKILDVLESKGISQKHIYTSVGITQSTWIKKVREQKFTTEEMIKICTIINS